METFLEILKITLPALLVMITAWLVIRNMLRDDQDRRRQDLLLQTVKTITPVKLQAYERIVSVSRAHLARVAHHADGASLR